MKIKNDLEIDLHKDTKSVSDAKASEENYQRYSEFVGRRSTYVLETGIRAYNLVKLLQWGQCRRMLLDDSSVHCATTVMKRNLPSRKLPYSRPWRQTQYQLFVSSWMTKPSQTVTVTPRGNEVSALWLVNFTTFWLDTDGLRMSWPNQNFCIILGVLLL